MHRVEHQHGVRPMQYNPWQNWIPDSMMWTLDLRLRVQDSTLMDSEFQKVCFPGFRIHDVNSGSQVLDSRFHLSGFRISKGLFSWIPDPWCELRILGTGFKIPPQWIPDSMMWTPEPRYWIQDSTLVDSGFQKVCFPGFRNPIPGLRIPKNRILDFRFHKQICFGYQIPRAIASWISESG